MQGLGFDQIAKRVEESIHLLTDKVSSPLTHE